MLFSTAALAWIITTEFFHMQIRYPIDLTLEEYIEQKAWQQAELTHCPKEHVTIGLLPDFFSFRFPGTLDEVEETVKQISFAEQLALFRYGVIADFVNLPPGTKGLCKQICTLHPDIQGFWVDVLGFMGLTDLICGQAHLASPCGVYTRKIILHKTLTKICCIHYDMPYGCIPRLDFQLLFLW